MSLYAQAKCVMIDLRLRSGERLNFCPAINCLFRLTSGDTVLGDAITLLFYFQIGTVNICTVNILCRRIGVPFGVSRVFNLISIIEPTRVNSILTLYIFTMME